MSLTDEEKLLQDKLIQDEFIKRFLGYKPHSKQLAFHEAGLHAQERYIGGGNRTGKTYGGNNELAMHLTGRYPSWWNGYRFNRPVDCWYIGKTSDLIADTAQKELLPLSQVKRNSIIHKSLILKKEKAGSSRMYRTVLIENINGGASELTFKTHEEGRETFQGAMKDIIFFDEEPPMEIYKESKIRTMSTSKDFRAMVMVCATPLKGVTDFYNYFADNRHPGVVQNSIWYEQITWDDASGHLTAEEKARMMQGMSPREIEARTKGIPWPGSGMCYPIPLDMITCDPIEIPKYWRKIWAIDFGWIHPTAVIFLAHDTDNDVIYAYAEYCVSERTPENHIYALDRFKIHQIPGVYDPAGKISRQGDGENLVNLYKKAGLKNMQPANNSVEEGIQEVLQRMQTGRLKVFKSLSKTLSEFSKYSRDDKGIPNKINDDLMDALRYGVMSIKHARPEKERENTDYQRFNRSVSYGGGGWMAQ